MILDIVGAIGLVLLAIAFVVIAVDMFKFLGRWPWRS